MEKKKLTTGEIIYGLSELQNLNDIELAQTFIKNVIKHIKYQKAEIERLTRELDETVSMNEMYVEKVRQNAELQKQVDYLKQAKEIFVTATEGFVFNFTADSEDYKNGYDKAIDDYDNKLTEYLKERYGVEVE